MKKRNINLDLIRCVAVLFVVSVHFCLNSGFYNIPCAGMRMLIVCILRTAFITCVPLFLMLTGYLMNKKELKLSYYKGIKKTYILYIIICIFCLAFRVLVQHEKLMIRQMILSIFDFTANKYSWYIEMYIGLFLLIPFLNILWNNMDSVKQKWLIVTLLCVSTLPSLLNCWNIFMIESDTRVYNSIIPAYWENLYFFTYYFLGAYLSDRKIKIKLQRNIVILIGLMVIFGCFTYYRSYNTTYEWTAYNSYQGIQVVIITFLLFRILLALPLEKSPNIIKSVIYKISEFSLGIYLASAITDAVIYPELIERVTNAVRRMDYLPIVVSLSFIAALIISGAANIIYKILANGCNKIKILLRNQSRD